MKHICKTLDCKKKNNDQILKAFIVTMHNVLIFVSVDFGMKHEFVYEEWTTVMCNIICSCFISLHSLDQEYHLFG